MKSSQSNFNLRSPGSYLACSYLIATVPVQCAIYKQYKWHLGYGVSNYSREWLKKFTKINIFKGNFMVNLKCTVFSEIFDLPNFDILFWLIDFPKMSIFSCFCWYTNSVCIAKKNIYFLTFYIFCDLLTPMGTLGAVE